MQAELRVEAVAGRDRYRLHSDREEIQIVGGAAIAGIGCRPPSAHSAATAGLHLKPSIDAVPASLIAPESGASSDFAALGRCHSELGLARWRHDLASRPVK
jgi:hypothetical protein